MNARPYQTAAIERVLELFATLVRRVLLVLPTGGGKTVIASILIMHFLAQGKRVLMLAHRRELIKQAFCKAVRNGVDPRQIGIIMAATPWRLVDDVAPDPSTLSDEELWRVWARRRPQAPFQIGSIDTFRNHVHPEADLVIVDEAHRALAKSYCDVQLAYPNAFHLGLTATPFRADGKGLGDAYDEIVIGSTYEDLIEEGFLVRPTVYNASGAIDLSKVKKKGNDYDQEELARAADKGELLGDIVAHWQRMGNDAPTFCFAVNVAHSKHLVERFLEAGVPAMHVDANTENEDRARALSGLRDGSVRVVCNCNVFTEGTDVVEVKTIILARPTLSEGLYMQQAGRGSRPFGDREFVILDHAGCSEAFGRLPHWPIEVSLEGRKKRSSTRGKAVKTCPQCRAMVPPATRLCEGCGYEWTAKELEAEEAALKEADGELKRVEDKPKKEKAPLSPKEQRALAHWDGIVADWEHEKVLARQAGKKLPAGGTCLTRWRNEIGRKIWPPKGSHGVPALTTEELAYNETIVEAPPRGAQIAIKGFDVRSLPSAMSRHLEEWAL